MSFRCPSRNSRLDPSLGRPLPADNDKNMKTFPPTTHEKNSSVGKLSEGVAVSFLRHGKSLKHFCGEWHTRLIKSGFATVLLSSGSNVSLPHTHRHTPSSLSLSCACKRYHIFSPLCVPGLFVSACRGELSSHFARYSGSKKKKMCR